jgi:hypothetical protein
VSKTVTINPFDALMACLFLLAAILWLMRAARPLPEDPKTPMSQTVYFEVLHMRCQATFFGALDTEKIQKLAEMVRDPRLDPPPSERREDAGTRPEPKDSERVEPFEWADSEKPGLRHQLSRQFSTPSGVAHATWSAKLTGESTKGWQIREAYGWKDNARQQPLEHFGTEIELSTPNSQFGNIMGIASGVYYFDVLLEQTSPVPLPYHMEDLVFELAEPEKQQPAEGAESAKDEMP